MFIVGAGPVATALAGALRLGGVPVLGLWARNPAAARAAGAIAGVGSYSAAPPDLVLESDGVLLAVRDDAIGEVASTLVATGLISKRHVLLHCSGAIAAHEAFAGVRDQVGGIATLHPLRAIADGREAMRELAGTVFGIEGDEAGRQVARALAAAIGGRALELSGEQMAAYHAAAAMASNYVVALLDAAASLLEEGGVPADDAVAALVPLAAGAVDNVRERGTTGGLTGPIRRGDQATVARHLEAIPDRLRPLYRALGLRTLEVARRAGVAPKDDLDAIEGLLSGTPGSAARASNG
jgi:predicted short-subunit dehydrogenase-like oxidoreductase (DUF2520 family)